MDAKTTVDWLLAYNTDAVTAEQLWRISYPECALDHADLGFKTRYERLAKAVNDITGMYGRTGGSV